MGPIDFLVLAIIIAIAGGAVAYIIKSKKSGKRCIGCPDADSCGAKSGSLSGGCSGNCQGCGGHRQGHSDK